MLHGKINGIGRLVHPQKHIVYHGSFRDGYFNGKGKLYMHGALVYEGDFQHDKPHGKGRQTPTKGCMCVGEFQNGVLHGMVAFCLFACFCVLGLVFWFGFSIRKTVRGEGKLRMIPKNTGRDYRRGRARAQLCVQGRGAARAEHGLCDAGGSQGQLPRLLCGRLSARARVPGVQGRHATGGHVAAGCVCAGVIFLCWLFLCWLLLVLSGNVNWAFVDN